MLPSRRHCYKFVPKRTILHKSAQICTKLHKPPQGYKFVPKRTILHKSALSQLLAICQYAYKGRHTPLYRNLFSADLAGGVSAEGWNITGEENGRAPIMCQRCRCSGSRSHAQPWCIGLPARESRNCAEVHVSRVRPSRGAGSLASQSR